MSEPHRKSRRWPIYLGILVALFAAGAWIFLRVGQWLVVEDPPAHVHAIVVLSGHLPDRAVEAARLYLEGYADQVWVSQPVSPEEALRKMNIAYVGEDFYNEKILIAQGVPPDSIRILEKPAANTAEEVSEITADLQRDAASSAMIVTSKPHTRRVRSIWRRLAPPDLHMLVRYPADDPYDGARWWRHTHDALDVVREVLGLFNAWAGFPVHASES